jgi:hypothetical protein
MTSTRMTDSWLPGAPLEAQKCISGPNAPPRRSLAGTYVAYADQLTEAASTNPRCISRVGRRVVSDIRRRISASYRSPFAAGAEARADSVPLSAVATAAKDKTDLRREIETKVHVG